MSQRGETALKVSVVIPVRDAHESLQRTLRSLLKQDPIYIEELIVVENGSAEIKTLPTLPFRSQLIHLARGSRSRARNTGAQASRADWILFLDADVELPQNWLTEVAEHITTEVVSLQTAIIPVRHDWSMLQRIRKFRALVNGGYKYLSLIKSNPQKIVLNSACFIVRRDIFNKMGGFDEELTRHEDLDFTQRLIREEVLIKGISSIRCFVHFEGSFYDYLLREFSCGFHIVRLHEKWNHGTVAQSLVSLLHRIFQWCKKLRTLITDRAMIELHLIELVFIAGSLFGIFRRITSPYRGDVLRVSACKARIEIL